MSLLLNRKYGSRIECLHTILYTIEKQGKSLNFTQSDLKHDDNNNFTVTDCCPLLKNTLGNLYCPYLDNNLDSSKCYATQSVESDSTKGKAVSDVAGSLEALGFISKRSDNNNYCITRLGKKFVATDYLSVNMARIIESGVISYGPILGFLHSVYTKHGRNPFLSSSIYVGYPKTDENIENLNLGSTDDSVKRTRSRLVSWCLSAGLLEIPSFKSTNTSPHISNREILNRDKLNIRKFKISEKAIEILQAYPFIENPLFYTRLNKNVGSKRERNGEAQRITEMELNPKILARRYYLLKLLNYAGKNKAAISFENLTKMFSVDDELKELFTDISLAADIIATELEIGNIAGIPYKVVQDDHIKPISTINEAVLEIDTPSQQISFINSYLEEDKYEIFV